MRTTGRWILVLVGSLVLGGCQQTIVLDDIGPTAPTVVKVTCSVSRLECTGFQFDAGGNATCPPANTVPFTISQVTNCFDSTNVTAQEACDVYCQSPRYDLAGVPADAASCHATILAEEQNAVLGECSFINGSSNGNSARASCTRGGRICLPTNTQTNAAGTTICTSDTVYSEAGDQCFDPTTATANAVCENNFISPTAGSLAFGWVDVTGVTLNSSLCPPKASTALTSAIAYGIPAGSVGNAVYSGTTTPLIATGGSMTVGESCDSDNEFCHPSEISNMRMTFADTVVEGVPVTNLQGSLLVPAPLSGLGSVVTAPKASFQFQIFGTTPLGRSLLLISPSQDLTLNVNTTTVSLSGPFNSVGNAAGNTIVPVAVNVSLAGSTSNPGAACAGQSPAQLVLGFEDLNGWKSAQAALSLSPTLHTQGCYGLNVAGSGYMTVSGAPITTPLPGVTATLGLDVLVPPGQPNPFWFGAVQMFLSCPVENTFNAYLGQVELTGKPTGVFSTASYALNAAEMTLLSQAHNDCFFSIAVNVNATPTPVVIDNIRFLQ